MAHIIKQAGTFFHFLPYGLFKTFASFP